MSHGCGRAPASSDSSFRLQHLHRLQLPSAIASRNAAARTCIRCAVVQPRKVLEAVERQLLRWDAQLMQQLAHLQHEEGKAAKAV